MRNEWHRIQRHGTVSIYYGHRSLVTGPYNIRNHHQYMLRARYNQVQALHFAQETLRRHHERRRERRRDLWELDSDSESDESDDDIDGGQLVAEDYVSDIEGEYHQHAPAA